MKKPAKKASRKEAKEKTPFEELIDLHKTILEVRDYDLNLWNIYNQLTEAGDKVLEAAQEVHGWKYVNADFDKDMERLGYRREMVESQAI